ncbi:MAG: hypothetical protein WBV61_02080, partial [Rhodanobacteraceae bacterium]
MKHMILNSIFLALVSSAPAFAQQPIEQTRAVDADARIDISNIKGSVTVTAWNRNEVHVSGTLGDGAKGLKIDGDHGHLTIKVEPPDNRGWFSWGADSHMGNTVLEVSVPHTAQLKLETVSADVAVSGVDGQMLDANTVSGKLRIDSSVKQI